MIFLFGDGLSGVRDMLNIVLRSHRPRSQLLGVGHASQLYSHDLVTRGLSTDDTDTMNDNPLPASQSHEMCYLGTGQTLPSPSVYPFTTLLPLTIHLVEWTITRDNRFVFFVLCEHLIILCQ